MIDNNPAHVNAFKRLKDYTGLNLVYQPSESPEFNSQETVWRMVKHAYRKKMFRRDSDLIDQNEHKQFILEVLEEVKAKIDMRKVLNANERYIQTLIACNWKELDQWQAPSICFWSRWERFDYKTWLPILAITTDKVASKLKLSKLQVNPQPTTDAQKSGFWQFPVQQHLAQLTIASVGHEMPLQQWYTLKHLLSDMSD